MRISCFCPACSEETGAAGGRVFVEPAILSHRCVLQAVEIPIRGMAVLRIYAVSDIHSDQGRIEQVERRVKEFDPDVLALAGDICGILHPRRVMESLARMPVPILMVRGNSDSKRVGALAQSWPNIRFIHLERSEIGQTPFVGVGGTVPVPFRSRIAFRESRIIEKARRLMDARCVLLVHPPPHGVLDKVLGRYSAGSRALSRLIVEKKPPLVICGHIHEASGKARLEDTWVVNCSFTGRSQGAVVDISEEGGVDIEMLECARPGG